MIQDKETRQWAMILHLSQLAGFLIPFAGLIVPILIWQLKKDEMPELDVHGKIIANWIISELIYSFICLILVIVAIGLLLFFLLGTVSVIFPIIGAIKANEGRVWKYPFSMSFV